MASSPSLTIQSLNDAMRKAIPEVAPNNRILLTRGVQALPPLAQIGLLIDIREFDDFTEDNDPHGEHDFGAIEQSGIRYFWKIDYYDLQMRMHSPDAADPAITCRVMTVMRADEY